MMAATATVSVEELLRQLEAEKRKSAMLEAKNTEMRQRMGYQQSVLEAEEENITNKLMARIDEIEKEKAEVALRVEKEEDQLRCAPYGSCTCPISPLQIPRSYPPARTNPTGQTASHAVLRGALTAGARGQEREGTARKQAATTRCAPCTPQEGKGGSRAAGRAGGSRANCTLSRKLRPFAKSGLFASAPRSPASHQCGA